LVGGKFIYEKSLDNNSFTLKKNYEDIQFELKILSYIYDPNF